MQRIGCVSVPALALQLALHQHPTWRAHPVVVVEHERPTARILWTNRPAQHVAIVRGMRFSEAKALTACLHASVLDPERIVAAQAELLRSLLHFSPTVMPDPDIPGVFHFNPEGLHHLFGTYESLARRIHQRLRSDDFHGTVVIGFQRYSTYALSKVLRGVLVTSSPHDELQRARAVPLARLDLAPPLVADLAMLGVHTLGAFMLLSLEDVWLRLGSEAAHLHQRAHGHALSPLVGELPVEPLTGEFSLEPPDATYERLLFALKTALGEVMLVLEARGLALASLLLRLELDHAPSHCEDIQTAAPTRDLLLVLELVRLRLSSLTLVAEVSAVQFTVRSSTAGTSSQMSLLAERHKRDVQAAARALARVRAAFGEGSVTVAQLVPGILPEARFMWAPVVTPILPRVQLDIRQCEPLPFVRRVFNGARQISLSLRDLQHVGPHRLSGGWWTHAAARDYYYVDRDAACLWVYFDHLRQRWRLHGVLD